MTFLCYAKDVISVTMGSMNDKREWIIVPGVLVAIVFCLLTACGQKHENRASLAGVWTAKEDESFVIDIWQDKKGLFHISATKPLDDTSVCFWECQGKPAGKEHEIPYYNGTKTIMTYDMDGNENEEPVYTGGQGTFYQKDGALFWTDRKEGAADGVTFVYTGEY